MPHDMNDMDIDQLEHFVVTHSSKEILEAYDRTRSWPRLRILFWRLVPESLWVAVVLGIFFGLLALAAIYHPVGDAQADPVPVYVEGDFDFDEDVDLYDFAVFQRNFTAEYGGGPG